MLSVFVCICSVDCEDGVVSCEQSCLVLERDFLLSGELEFGDPEIIGLNEEAGMWCIHVLVSFLEKVMTTVCVLQEIMLIFVFPTW